MLKIFQEKCIPLLMQQNHHFAWRMSLTFLRQDTPPNIFPLVATEGARSGKGFLTPEMVKQLFKQGNKIVGENEYGRRKVLKLSINSQGIFAKIYPELPGMEEAIRVLANQLFGFLVPESELFQFEEQGKTTKSYPVLLSQEVKGLNCQDVLKKAYIEKDTQSKTLLQQIDAYRFSQLFLLSILTHPEDGKPDNYILTPIKNHLGEDTYAIVGIDNDHAFVDSFISEKGQSKLQVKTIIYCLDQMKQPLHPKAIKEFLRCDVKTKIETWLNNLISCQQNYETLFPLEIRQALLKKESVTQIPLPSGAITKLYERWMRLKNNLQRYPYFSHLQILIRTEPMIGLAYQTVWGKYEEPLARFHEIASPSYFFTPQKGNYKTLVTSRQLLKTQKIGEKALISGNASGPVEAKEELSRMLSYQINVQKWIDALNNKQIECLKEIQLNSIKQQVLKEVDFKAWTDEEQNQLIKILLSEEYGLEGADTLYLNGLRLTMKQLKFLLKRQERLIKLVIRDNPFIDNTLSDLLTTYSDSLESLVLQSCQGITYFQSNNIIPDNPRTVTLFTRHPGTVVFSELKYLQIDNLSQLKSIQLLALYLRQLTLKQLPLCEEIGIKTKSLSSLIIPNQVSIKTIEQWILSNPMLQMEGIICDNQVTRKALALIYGKQNKWSQEVLNIFLSGTTLDLSEFTIEYETILEMIPHAITLKIQSLLVKENFPVYLLGVLSLTSLESVKRGKKIISLTKLHNAQKSFRLKVSGKTLCITLEPNQNKLMPLLKKFLNSDTLTWQTPDTQTLLAHLIFLWSLKPVLVEWPDFETSGLSHKDIQILLHFNVPLQITATSWSYSSLSLFINNSKENLAGVINDMESVTIFSESAVTTLSLLPNHQFATGDIEGMVKLFSSDSYEVLNCFELDEPIYGMTNVENKLFMFSQTGAASLWDSKTKEKLFSWKGRLAQKSGSYALSNQSQLFLPMQEEVPEKVVVALTKVGDANRDVRRENTKIAPETFLNKVSEVFVERLLEKLSNTSIVAVLQQQSLIDDLLNLEQNIPEDFLLKVEKIYLDEEESSEFRTHAAVLLFKSGYINVISLLDCAGRAEHNYTVQKSVESIFSTRMSSKFISDLITVTEHPEAEIRRRAYYFLAAACKSLGKLRQATPEVIAALLKTKRDTNDDVRLSAIKALGKLEQATPQVITTLLEALGDSDKSIHQSASHALGTLGQTTPEVINSLMRAMMDPSENVRENASHALGELFSLNSKLIFLWDIQTQKLVARLNGHQNTVNAIFLGKNNRCISASKDKTLKIWDTDKKTCLKTLNGHTESVTCVIASNQHIMSGSEDTTIRIWDSQTGAALKILSGHKSEITALLLLSSEKILSSSKDKTLKIWNMNTGTCLTTLPVNQVITDFMILPNGAIAMLAKRTPFVYIAQIERAFNINFLDLAEALPYDFSLRVEKEENYGLIIQLDKQYEEKEIKIALKTLQHFLSSLGIIAEFEYQLEQFSLKIIFNQESLLKTAMMLLEALNTRFEKMRLQQVATINQTTPLSSSSISATNEVSKLSSEKEKKLTPDENKTEKKASRKFPFITSSPASATAEIKNEQNTASIKKSTFFQSIDYKTILKKYQREVQKFIEEGWKEMRTLDDFFAPAKTQFEKEILLETLEWIKNKFEEDENKLQILTHQLSIQTQFIQFGKKPKEWNKEAIQLLLNYASYLKTCFENSSDFTERQNLQLLSDECEVCSFVIKALLQGKHKKLKEEKSLKQLEV